MTRRFSRWKNRVFPTGIVADSAIGAFGNELFIVAKALVEAQRLQYPVLLTRRADRGKGILVEPYHESNMDGVWMYGL